MPNNSIELNFGNFFADAPQLEITHSLILPQEGQYFKLECVSIGNPM